MKRRFFLVAGAGSLALRPGNVGARSRIGSRATAVSLPTVRFANRTSRGAVPGGCSTHRTASASGGYTLAFALGRLPQR